MLTERTDVLVFGRVRCQFWVTGRFDVRDGQITLWRDSYDYLDLTRAFLRGVAGALVPALRPAAAGLARRPARPALTTPTRPHGSARGAGPIVSS